jgi:pimeloyl-ACP methyl ester carboxylesterase
MSQLTFAEIQHKLEELFQLGEYWKAYQVAEAALPLYPEHRMVLAYWCMTMAARAGRTDLTLAALDARLDDGDWFGELLLRRSPSLENLQNDAAFELLVKRNQELSERDHQGQYPLLILREEGYCQPGAPGCPLLIALHANASTNQETLPFWRPAASMDWLVGVPLSNQAMWKGAYMWDDRELAEKEIQTHYTALVRQYGVDPQRCVVAGHSMGGEVAIWLALNASIPVCGFLAIGPAGPFFDDLENWIPLLERAAARGLRGAIIFGQEDDTIPQENILEFAAQLEAAGITCQVEEIPDVGHAFSLEYEAAILRGLDFILER